MTCNHENKNLGSDLDIFFQYQMLRKHNLILILESKILMDIIRYFQLNIYKGTYLHIIVQKFLFFHCLILEKMLYIK